MLLDMKLDLLKEEQIYGENRLKVFDLIGTKAAVTDYAILCGAYVSDNYYIDDIKSLENRTGWYWTKTDDGNNDALVVSYDGYSYWNDVSYRQGCVRPALSFSEIKDFCSDEIIGEYGELKYICGELPGQVVSEELEKELKIKLKNGLLKEKKQKQKVYEDEITGKRYAYIKAKPCRDRCILSNGKTYQKGDYVFVERQPIYWVRDEETDIVFTEKLIASGVQFNLERNYKGDFEKTDLYHYMNTYLVRDIFSLYQKNIKLSSNINITSKIEDLRNQNIYLSKEIISMQRQIDENNKEISMLSMSKGGYQKVKK